MLSDTEIDALPGTEEFKKGIKSVNAKIRECADSVPRPMDPFEDEYKYRQYLISCQYEVEKYMTAAAIAKADAQEAAAKVAREEARRNQEAVEWRQKLMSVNVAEMHRDCSFDNYEISNECQRKLVEALKTDKSTWFIFCGKTGTGKNHLAAAVIRDRLKNGKTAVLWKVKRLMDEQISMTAIEKVQKLRELESVDLLILNELGRSSEKKFFQDTIFDLLDERHENNKQTILITNLDYEELLLMFSPKNTFGEADTSLQRRLQRSTVFKFNWEAYVPRGASPTLFPKKEDRK